MKRISYLALLIFLCPVLIFSQGFEWELSPRLPFSIPKLYLGISTNFSKNFFKGSLSLYEKYYTCAIFSTGNGNSNSFGVRAEYWFEPAVALNLGILFLNSGTNFTALGDSFKILVKDIPKVVKVENELSFKHIYLLIDLGAKYRISSTNIYFAGNLEFGFKLSSSFDLYEQVLSPPEYHFVDNSQRRKILDGDFSKFSTLVISPKFSVGYDAIIYPKIYATPSISIYIPVFNMSSKDNLKMLAIQLGFSILYGTH